MESLNEALVILKNQFAEGIISDKFISEQIKKYYEALEIDYQIGKKFYKNLKSLRNEKWKRIVDPSKASNELLKNIGSSLNEAINLAKKIPQYPSKKWTVKPNILNEDLQRIIDDIQYKGSIVEQMDKLFIERIAETPLILTMDNSIKKIKWLRFQKSRNKLLFKGFSFILIIIFYGLSFFITLKIESISEILNIKYLGLTDIALKIVIFSFTAILIDGFISKIKVRFRNYFIRRSIDYLLDINSERDALIMSLDDLRKNSPDLDL
jgi:hypothetical protein